MEVNVISPKYGTDVIEHLRFSHYNCFSKSLYASVTLLRISSPLVPLCLSQQHLCRVFAVMNPEVWKCRQLKHQRSI